MLVTPPKSKAETDKCHDKRNTKMLQDGYSLSAKKLAHNTVNHGQFLKIDYLLNSNLHFVTRQYWSPKILATVIADTFAHFLLY